VAIIAGVAAAGCGGSSSTSTPALDVATFAERYCALFAPCCTDVGVTQGGMCTMTIGNNARLVGKVSALGETCLAELKAKFDGFGFCNFGLSATPSCDSVLGWSSTLPGGTLPPGGDCTNDHFACAPSTRGAVGCTFDLSTSDFVLRCQEQIPGGAAGDGPCVGSIPADGGLLSSGSTFVASGYTCAIADGVYCDSTANACAAVRKPGEPCSSVDPAACPTGFCVDDICTARSGLGESCAITQVCVDSAYCDGVCAKRKPPGAACHGLSNECAVGQCTDAVCVPPWTASALGFLCEA